MGWKQSWLDLNAAETERLRRQNEDMRSGRFALYHRDGLTGAMHDITEMEIARNDAAVTALGRINRRLRTKIDEEGDQD